MFSFGLSTSIPPSNIHCVNVAEAGSLVFTQGEKREQKVQVYGATDIFPRK